MCIKSKASWMVSLGIVGIEKLRTLNGPAVLKERVQGAEIGIVHKRAECRRIAVREDVTHCLGEAPERVFQQRIATPTATNVTFWLAGVKSV
jgi:hypothetical protein